LPPASVAVPRCAAPRRPGKEVNLKTAFEQQSNEETKPETSRWDVKSITTKITFLVSE
jgi:hypothetical protein